MQTAELVGRFMDEGRSRGLQAKTLEYYQWALDKLMMQCPEFPMDAAQIARVYDNPRLGRVSINGVERATRIFLGWV